MEKNLKVWRKIEKQSEEFIVKESWCYIGFNKPSSGF